MTKPSEPIVFFGSGPVAKASLDALAQHCPIEAVVTKASTSAEMAAGLSDIPQHLVKNKAELTALLAAQPFESTLGIIVDFGIIVEQAVIDYFPLGIINAHFSLLPAWRGADPISFSILSGDTETGVSLMLINVGLDEGQLLAQENLPIDASDTTASLTDKLIRLSNDMLSRYLPLYRSGKLLPFDQPDQPVTYSRKLTKEDGLIDWTKPAVEIERSIRAFQPWPKSTTTLGGLQMTISRARLDPEIPADQPASKPAGTPEIVGKNGLRVYCGRGALLLDEVTPAGKKTMTSAALLAGHRQKFI